MLILFNFWISARNFVLANPSLVPTIARGFCFMFVFLAGMFVAV